jgi:hypothetical protein
MKRVIPALALLLASAPAFAQPRAVDHVRTTADLGAICDPGTAGVPRLEAIAYCQGFLTAAGQYHALMNPPGIALARWVRENPSHAHEPALDGLLRWAQASFPCPAEPSTRRAR